MTAAHDDDARPGGGPEFTLPELRLLSRLAEPEPDDAAEASLGVASEFQRLLGFGYQPRLALGLALRSAIADATSAAVEILVVRAA